MYNKKEEKKKKVKQQIISLASSQDFKQNNKYLFIFWSDQICKSEIKKALALLQKVDHALYM